MPRRVETALALALLVLLAAAQITSALGESATWDEPVHLAAGNSYLATGSFEMNPEHPPLAKILFALPGYLIWKPEPVPEDWDRSQAVLTANLFLYRNRVDPDRLLISARLVNIALTLLFAAYTAWWTRRRFGTVVSLFALALFALDPNLIAHGRYATTDLAAAFLIFTAATLWIEYLLTRHVRWLVLTGLSLGAACAAKFSGLYLAPLLLTLFWLRPRPVRERAAEFLKCSVALPVLAGAVICLAYWPEMRHLRKLEDLAPRITRSGPAGTVLSFAADRLHSKAFTFLIGIDRLSEHEAAGHPGYLLGEIREAGWWYYFPVAFGVKTPLATLAGMFFAAVIAFRRRAELRSNWLPVAVLALTAAVYFVISTQSRLQIGIRHLLPVYVPLFVLSAWAILATPRGRWVAAGLVVLLGLESAAVYPNYLTFFNAAAGGPRSGPKYLLDSNLDWGQAVKQLGAYVKARNIPRVCLALFGNVDVVREGIHTAPLPGGSDPASIDCVAAVSATPLFGLYAGPGAYARFRALKPDAIIGNSIYVYDLRKGGT